MMCTNAFLKGDYNMLSLIFMYILFNFNLIIARHSLEALENGCFKRKFIEQPLIILIIELSLLPGVLLGILVFFILGILSWRPFGG